LVAAIRLYCAAMRHNKERIVVAKHFGGDEAA
jgi:hypothetical protein